MKNFILLFIAAFTSGSFATQPCTKAGKDYNKFFELSIGQMIEIANSKEDNKKKLELMESLISPCVDTRRITTRVLGKSKWESMTPERRQNFIMEYKKFFVINFGEIILSTLKDVESYTFQGKRGFETYYIVTLKYFPKSTKETLSIEIEIEELENYLQILDGKFGEVSFVNIQRDLFDRLYSENPDCVLQFNAKDYIKNQCK